MDTYTYMTSRGGDIECPRGREIITGGMQVIIWEWLDDIREEVRLIISGAGCIILCR